MNAILQATTAPTAVTRMLFISLGLAVLILILNVIRSKTAKADKQQDKAWRYAINILRIVFGVAVVSAMYLYIDWRFL